MSEHGANLRYSIGGHDGDTLFAGSKSVTIDMDSQTRDSGSAGAAAWEPDRLRRRGCALLEKLRVRPRAEPISAARIKWKVTRRRHLYDDTTNKFTTTVEATNGSTRVGSVTTTINVRERIGRTTIAADVVDETSHHDARGRRALVRMWASGADLPGSEQMAPVRGGGVTASGNWTGSGHRDQQPHILRERGAELPLALLYRRPIVRR